MNIKIFLAILGGRLQLYHLHFIKMNQKMLRDIASKGKGKYFQLGSGKDEINAIFKELGRINTKDFEELIFTDFNDQFQWCLAIAAVLLLIEWFISERKFSFKF